MEEIGEQGNQNMNFPYDFLQRNHWFMSDFNVAVLTCDFFVAVLMYTLAQEIIFPQKLQKDLAKLDKKCFLLCFEKSFSQSRDCFDWYNA